MTSEQHCLQPIVNQSVYCLCVHNMFCVAVTNTTSFNGAQATKDTIVQKLGPVTKSGIVTKGGIATPSQPRMPASAVKGEYACQLLSSTTAANQRRPVTVETTKLPAPTADVVFSSPRVIPKGTCFDGGMTRFTRNQLCAEQLEGNETHTVFLLEEGGTLQNAIIGKNQREGVYCLGSCTIRNVWWEDVCEDALTAKGDGNVTVYGGGAFHAEDKVIQHNGLGTVTIEGFYAEDFGKMYASCGNCFRQGQRHVVVRNVVAVNGTGVVGINKAPYRDTATLHNVTTKQVKMLCRQSVANSVGGKPLNITGEVDGVLCRMV